MSKSAGQIPYSVTPNAQGGIVHGINTFRKPITSGLVRRALGKTEVEITAGDGDSTLDFLVGIDDELVSLTGGPVDYDTDDPTSVAAVIAAINANAANHNVWAAQGTNSSHVGLIQRRGGAFTSALQVVVTGTAAVEGGGAVADFSGDTDTWTEVVSGAAANIPTAGGPFELGFDITKVDKADLRIIAPDTPRVLDLQFVSDQAVEYWSGRFKPTTASALFDAPGTGRTLSASIENTIPCVDANLVNIIGIVYVASDAVIEYWFRYI
jgi:hypothetical protein